MAVLGALVRNKRKNRLYRFVPPKLLVPIASAINAATREPELRLLKHLVHRGQVSVDVGANRGVYTYRLSLLSARVVAYEPNPALCAALRSLGRPNVEVRQLALSSSEGEAELLIPFVDGVELDSRGSLCLEGAGRRVRVPTRRLDEEGLSGVGLVKIDVEGHEEAVLEGAAGLIERERPNLIIEIEQRFRSGDIRETFHAVESFGYRGYYVHGGRVHPLERFSVERHQTALLPDVLHPDYVNNFIFRPH